MKYRVGDSVVVTTGSDRGTVSTIQKILSTKNKVLLEGVNMKKKNIKPYGGNPGQQVDVPAPIDISNIAIVDPQTGKPSRVQYEITKEGAKKRISQKSKGEIIIGQGVKAADKAVAPSKKAPKTIKA